MSMRLVNRHGLLALPLIFLLNICVTVVYVFLVYINEAVALFFGFFWAFYLLVQTKLMIIFIFVLIAGGTIISGFTPEVTQSQVFLATIFLSVSTLVAHGIAFTVTAVTGL